MDTLSGEITSGAIQTLASKPIPRRSIVIAGGASLSTVANGITAFIFYAVAFVGGWIEQIGVVLGSADARYIGTMASLVSPTDALWRLAMYALEPPVMAQVMVTPFTPRSVPTAPMVWWASI